MKQKSKIESVSVLELKKIVKLSKSIRQVLKSLGYKNFTTVSYKNIKERIKKEEISVDHMKRYCEYGKYITPIEEILVENSTYKNNYRLKIRLVKEGIMEYVCGECDNKGEWRQNSLSLQLDHKNGINNDNRIKNLRFLCPNCHSQTITYSGKNVKHN